RCPPPTAIYPLSLHDALPIYARTRARIWNGFRQRASGLVAGRGLVEGGMAAEFLFALVVDAEVASDRVEPRGEARFVLEARGVRSESTRLNSSHVKISYAVFC